MARGKGRRTSAAGEDCGLKRRRPLRQAWLHGEGSAVSADLTTAEATALSAAQLRRVWKDTSPAWGLGTAADVWE